MTGGVLDAIGRIVRAEATASGAPRDPVTGRQDGMKRVGAGHVYRGRVEADHGGPGAAQEGARMAGAASGHRIPVTAVLARQPAD